MRLFLRRGFTLLFWFLVGGCLDGLPLGVVLDLDLTHLLVARLEHVALVGCQGVLTTAMIDYRHVAELKNLLFHTLFG